MPTFTDISGIGGCRLSYILQACATPDRHSRSGEAEKLAMRYRKFHLGGLVDATIKATGSSRNRCRVT